MTFVVPPDVQKLTAQMLNQTASGMSPSLHQPGMQPVGPLPTPCVPESQKPAPPIRLYSSGAYQLRQIRTGV